MNKIDFSKIDMSHIDINKTYLPELDPKNQRKPVLFYYAEALSAWVPAPEKVESILDAESHFSDDGEVVTIEFKRLSMTDYEIESLPED
jgi:hypothetical protein